VKNLGTRGEWRLRAESWFAVETKSLEANGRGDHATFNLNDSKGRGSTSGDDDVHRAVITPEASPGSE